MLLLSVVGGLGICLMSVNVVVLLIEMLLCVVLNGWYGWCDSSLSELKLYSVVRYSELMLLMMVVLISLVLIMWCVELNVFVLDEYVDEIVIVGLCSVKYVCMNVVGEYGLCVCV